jgi:hypothetical protein
MNQNTLRSFMAEEKGFEAEDKDIYEHEYEGVEVAQSV